LDIEYLLMLQNFREASNNLLTPLMNFISWFMDSLIYLLPFIVYWSFSKRGGLYLMFSHYVSAVLGQILKMTACALRPWAFDSRLKPSAAGLDMSYSMPSAHSLTAAANFGGLAVLIRNKSRLIAYSLILLIILAGFSRNYLGMHRPQDVLAGFALGAAVLYVVSRIFKFIDKYPEFENNFLLITAALAVIAIIYVKLKSYPVILIEGMRKPDDMMRAAFLCGGSLIGLALGRIVERKYINFEPLFKSGFNLKGLVLLIFGCVIFYYLDIDTDFINKIYKSEIMKIFIVNAQWRKFYTGFISVFFAVAGWPFVIKKLEHKDFI